MDTSPEASQDRIAAGDRRDQAAVDVVEVVPATPITVISTPQKKQSSSTPSLRPELLSAFAPRQPSPAESPPASTIYPPPAVGRWFMGCFLLLRFGAVLFIGIGRDKISGRANRFVVLGPHWPTLCLTLVLIIAPLGFLIVETSSTALASLWLLLIGSASISSLALCATCDPGVVRPGAAVPDRGIPSSLSSSPCPTPGVTPRSTIFTAPSPSGERIPLASPPSGCGDAASATPHVAAELVTYRRHSTGAMTSTILVAHQCELCHVLKPFRASHCRVCNVCVLRRDHHCPWTGICIGQRNYRFFFLFVWLTLVLCISGLAVVISRIVSRASAFAGASGDEPDGHLPPYLRAALATRFVEPTIGLLCFAGTLLLGGLASYHSMLAAQNLTSIEEHKRSQQLEAGLPVQPNPFYTTREDNCRQSLFGGASIPSMLLG